MASDLRPLSHIGHASEASGASEASNLRPAACSYHAEQLRTMYIIFICGSTPSQTFAHAHPKHVEGMPPFLKNILMQSFAQSLVHLQGKYVHVLL